MCPFEKKEAMYLFLENITQFAYEPIWFIEIPSSPHFWGRVSLYMEVRISKNVV